MLILVCFWLLSPKLTQAKEQTIDQASDYLYEYGVGLYRSGNTPEAIHELKKCLMINPNNLKCRMYLNLISTSPAPAPELRPLPRRALSKTQGRIKVSFNDNLKACVEEEISFYAKVKPESAADSLSYNWDFGDGTSANGRQVKKIYSRPGIYSVSLVTRDNLRLRAPGPQENRIRVYSPPVADAGKDMFICLGQSVIFDASESKVSNSIERCFNCDLLDYTWNFGDGTPEAKGIKVRHKYAQPGKYKATLTVRDGKNRKCSLSEDSVTVLVNTRPVLILREVKSTCVGKSVNFAAFLNATQEHYLNGNTLKYTWDFGDGEVIQGEANISHTYLKGGEYLVKVQVDDQLGTACSTDTQAIKVKVNTPPVANTGPNLVCCSNVKSVFDATSSSDADADALSYVWDFGDGDTAAGSQTTHVYKKKGKYKVSLTVDDHSGTECSSSVDRMEVSVSEKPVSEINIY